MIMKKTLVIAFLALIPLMETTAQRVYTLEQLKDSARHNNIALHNARLSVEEASELRKEAHTKFFPSVSASAMTFTANRGMAKMNVNPQEIIPSSLTPALSTTLPTEALVALQDPISLSLLKNGTIAGITAMQPVFAGGQIINSNKLAKVGEDVARLQLSLSDNEVEKQTERYFWQLVSLQEKMKTVDAVDTLLADIHKDVDVAVRAGLAMRNDLLEVELRQNDIESQRVKLQNGIAVVRLLLAQYCGLDNDNFHAAHTETKDLVPEALQEQIHVLPEYQLLEKQVEAAQLQTKLAQGQNLPTLAIGAGYNYHNMLKTDRTFGMVFATLTVPISDWWGGTHAVRRRKIELQQAQAQLADNQELLRIRTKKAWNDVMEAHQQLQLARRSIGQAKENLRLNRNHYQAGVKKMSDLLNAQLLYQQSLDRSTDAYADLQFKMLIYRQAAGIQIVNNMRMRKE